MNKNVFFSIVSNNYVAQVKALYKSVKEVYGDSVDFCVFINDNKNNYLSNDYFELNCIFASDIGIENFYYYALKYNVIEFNTFIKPFAIDYLLVKYQKVIYLDPDTFLFSKLIEVEDLLDKYPVVLTPHRITIDNYFNNEYTTILQSGFFNLGFVAFNNTPKSKEILKFWQNDLKHNCYNDVANHKFTDQKSMANIYYYYHDYIFSINHPGYNIAPWNFCERSIIKNKNFYYVHLIGETNNYYLRFFHFSGFKISDKNDFFNSKHSKLIIETNSALYEILTLYKKEMIKNNFLTFKKIPYYFDYFENGKYISRYERRVYSYLVDRNYINKSDNSFLTSSKFYSFIKRNNFLTSNQLKSFDLANANDLKNGVFSKKEDILKFFMVILRRLLGLKNYLLIMRYLSYASKYDYQMYQVERRLKHEKFD